MRDGEGPLSGLEWTFKLGAMTGSLWPSSEGQAKPQSARSVMDSSRPCAKVSYGR